VFPTFPVRNDIKVRCSEVCVRPTILGRGPAWVTPVINWTGSGLPLEVMQGAVRDENKFGMVVRLIKSGEARDVSDSGHHRAQAIS